MTLWVLHQPLTAEEEAQIVSRDSLALPFGDLPDLSEISGVLQAKQLLRTLHPGEPPEAIHRRVDKFWKIFSELQKEDVIAVPLPVRGEVALAEVNGAYRYEVGKDGADVHLIPVKWYAVLPMKKFSRHKEIFGPALGAMNEVTGKEARIAIREQLPHGYNRFVKWKWLLVVFFILGLVRVVEQVVRRL